MILGNIALTKNMVIEFYANNTQFEINPLKKKKLILKTLKTEGSLLTRKFGWSLERIFLIHEKRWEGSRKFEKKEWIPWK